MQQYNQLIAGEWREASSYTENRNPSDLSEVIGLYASGTAADVNSAVDAAAAAAEEWAHTLPQQRSDILDRAGTSILDRRDDIARLLAREEGKTLPEARGEVERAGRIFKYFAGEALRIAGDKLASVRPGIEVDIVREPVGLVGLITPWNFPIAIPAWKTAPALAFGNCVILKPAELTPAAAWEMAAALDAAGLPSGVFNLVMGSGRDVGEAMLGHPAINAVSFTGSVETGRHVAMRCAETHKRVQLEMGGKNPMVVLDDADLAQAIPTCIDSAFFSTGQRCTASSRLIVTRGIRPRFVEQLVAAMKDLKVGHALEDGVNIGPVASLPQLESNLRYVELARSEGAEVVGGERLTCATDGLFQAPALFLNAGNDFRTSREEIFGPCASVIEVDDFEQALAVANDTDFGLSAGICTTSLKYATEFRRRSAAGMVMVNLPTAGVDYHVPFGGLKRSSYGPREQGRHSIEFYTTTKTCYVRA